jgi:hypothetical protein
VYGLLQLVSCGALQYVSRGSQPKRLAGQLWIRIHREINQLHCATLCFQLPSGIKAVQQGHRDVEDDDIRMEPGKLVKERPSIGNRSDDLEVGLEQHLESLEQQQVVVGQ